jgi:hypothetical protein
VYGLDFVDDFQPGEQILRSSWEMIVTQGNDPDPNSHLWGPQIALAFFFVTGSFRIFC